MCVAQAKRARLEELTAKNPYLALYGRGRPSVRDQGASVESTSGIPSPTACTKTPENEPRNTLKRAQKCLTSSRAATLIGCLVHQDGIKFLILNEFLILLL